MKKYAKNYKNVYMKYLSDLFENTFGKKHGFNVENIFECELQIVNAYDCNIIKKEDPDNYNIIHKNEALEQFGFDWKAFASALVDVKTIA